MQLKTIHEPGEGGKLTRSRAHAMPARESLKQHGTAAHVLNLQQTCGNRGVQRVLALARQRSGENEVMPDVESAIEHARGGGQALESGSRGQMESAFGADFSQVRIHADTRADTLSRAVSARAFTTGQDIFFREGEYNPHNSGGRELLAHELAHVVQQNGPGIHAKLTVSQPDDALEREADDAANSIIQAEQQPETETHDNPQSLPLIAATAPPSCVAAHGMDNSQKSAEVHHSPVAKTPSGSIQRDPAPPGAAAAALPSYDPPAVVAAGTLPDNARIDSLGTVPDLPSRILSALPAPFSDSSYGTVAVIRTALNRETLRNHFNAYQGSGVTIQLQQCSDWIANFDGNLSISARIRNVRFLRADGVQISDTATSGVSATGAGSTATATGLTGGVTGSVGDPKEGGQAGANLGASSTTTVTSGGGTGTSGAGARSVSPNASAAFAFDVEWTVKVTYQRSPRTWNSILSLGVSNIISAIAEPNESRVISSTGTGGQLRIPIVDCIERST